MTNLYFFRCGKQTALVADRTWKEARNTLLNSVFGTNVKSLPDVQGFLLKGKCELPEGVVSVEEVAEHKSGWWHCGNDACDSSDFMIINNGTGYRCKRCGYEGAVVILKKDKENGKEKSLALA